MAEEQAAIEETSQRRLTATVTLDEPIKRGETIITEVTLKRPMGGALRGLSLAKLMNEAEFDEHIKLLPRISTPQITKADWDSGNLSPADLMQIVGEVSLFFVPRKHRQEIDATG
tara:strand:- start:3058 stop:3402 length:345 start_codon:yes stop_codon:yes gene_type:complete